MEGGVTYASIASSTLMLSYNLPLTYQAGFFWGVVWHPLARIWMVAPHENTTSDVKNRQKISKKLTGGGSRSAEIMSQGQKNWKPRSAQGMFLQVVISLCTTFGESTPLSTLPAPRRSSYLCPSPHQDDIPKAGWSVGLSSLALRKSSPKYSIQKISPK